MKFLKFYILNRIYFIIGLIVLGIVIYKLGEPVSAWICFILAFFSILLYFMLGTMRLVQEAVQEGDMDNAVSYLNKIKFPNLLFKPVRSAYYMLQSNVAMVNNDLAGAEANIKNSIKHKSKLMGDTEGMTYLQLATIELQKGKTKEARNNLLLALKHGIPDIENKAACYLQLSSIEIERKNFKIGKDYFRKAKALKPKSAQIVSQLKEMDKYMGRIPG